MDCEKVRDIFLHNLAAHQIGDKEPTQLTEWINGSWRQLYKPWSRRVLQCCRKGFTHHLVWVPMEHHQVLIWVQVVYGICLPFAHLELRWQLKYVRNPNSYHSFCEWRLCLPYQGIYNNWGICIDIDGIHPSIQVLDFLGGGLITMLMSSVILVRWSLMSLGFLARCVLRSTRPLRL